MFKKLFPLNKYTKNIAFSKIFNVRHLEFILRLFKDLYQGSEQFYLNLNRSEAFT